MVLRDFRIAPAVLAFALALLFFGGVLVGISWWIRPASEAEEALRDGNVQRAAERYGVARERFDKIPITRSLLRGIYNLVSENELALKYSLQRYDELIESADPPGTIAASSFWAGCALFGKALIEEKPEARLVWLQQAHQEFRRALELTPDDWDTKFNFELTGRLISRLQRQPQMDKQDLMKLLRASPKADRPTVRKTG